MSGLPNQEGSTDEEIQEDGYKEEPGGLARRVKCDEAKPHCKRCLEFWGSCEGYERISGTQVLVSRRALRPAAPSVTREPSIITNMFDDEFEYRYFQSFVNDIVPCMTLVGEFNCIGMLTYLVPQACWMEFVLRRGYIALGALHYATFQSVPEPMLSKNHDKKQIYAYALEKYQRAIRALREVKDVRTALIACLLIFCIEVNVQNLDLAFRQVHSGLKLLERCDRSVKLDVDDDLVAAFRTLEIHALNATGVSTHRLYKEVSTMAPTPASFSTIDEARIALEYNSAQSLYMSKRYIFSSNESKPCIKSTEKGTFFQVFAAGGIWSPLDKSRNSPDFITHHAAVTAMNSEWFAAADELWKKAQISGGRDFYRMAGLRVVALYSRISHLGTRMPQSGFDEYLPDFQEIVALIKGIMEFLNENGSDPQNGQLDTGILVGLAVVGLKCRHSSTRREAIEMTRRANRRESIWDSGVCAVAVNYVRYLEEGDQIVDFMPEQSRISLTGLWVDLENRVLRATWNPCKYFPEKVEEEGLVSW